MSHMASEVAMERIKFALYTCMLGTVVWYV